MARPSEVLGFRYVTLDGTVFCLDCAREVYVVAGHDNWHAAGRPGATFGEIDVPEISAPEG